MIQSSKTLAAAAVAGIGLSIAGFALVPFGGAGAVGISPVDQRIASAFAVAPGFTADPAIERAAQQARKGDLPARVSCAGQSWPAIASDCLVATDGTAARPARFVTVGYQTGPDASVLMRMPAPQIASR